MAGLLGYLAAGVATGVGSSLKEQAVARREERMRMLEMDRIEAREQRSRDFSSSENEKQRTFNAEQNRLSREDGGDPVLLADGTTGIRRGNKVETLTGPDGKPVKVATKAGDTPAEVATAEWLIRQKVAAGPKEAWDLVRQARSDPEKSRAAIFNKWVDALTKNSYSVDGGKIREEAQRLTEETLTYLDGAGEGNGATLAPSAPPPGKSTRVDAPSSSGDPASDLGAAAGSMVKPKDGSAPPAPRDPKQRVKGKVYSAPDGRKGKWTGNGWELVQ